jgi:hypothetical protein
MKSSHVLMFAILTLAMLYGSSPVRSQNNNELRVGKATEIRLATRTQVDNLLLPKGTYLIQHRGKGSKRMLQFTQLTRPYFPKPLEVRESRGAADCKMEILPQKIERTAVLTTEENGVTRITAIQIKGENVIHHF